MTNGDELRGPAVRLIFLTAVLLSASAGELHAEDAVAKGVGAFIPDFVYRVVAIWLCYACGQQLWNGLVERKITPWRNLLDFYKQTFHRDTTPIRYWFEISQMMFGVAASLFVVIFGWH